jgi:hypothetical protein
MGESCALLGILVIAMVLATEFISVVLRVATQTTKQWSTSRSRVRDSLQVWQNPALPHRFSQMLSNLQWNHL